MSSLGGRAPRSQHCPANQLALQNLKPDNEKSIKFLHSFDPTGDRSPANLWVRHVFAPFNVETDLRYFLLHLLSPFRREFHFSAIFNDSFS
jgi:hypothetical protein